MERVTADTGHSSLLESASSAGARHTPDVRNKSGGSVWSNNGCRSLRYRCYNGFVYFFEALSPVRFGVRIITSPGIVGGTAGQSRTACLR